MAFEFLKNTFGLKPEAKAISLTNADAFGLFGVSQTASGITVSPNSALRVPAVACAVGLIAETIGSLPAKVYTATLKQTANDQTRHEKLLCSRLAPSAA